MNNDALARQLDHDAQIGIPPFSSECLAIARQLGRAAVDLLLVRIQERGRSTFLALEALRGVDESAFNSLPVRDKAEIYAEALRSSIFFNAWGVPGYHLTDTSRALISLGQEAVNPLRPLLDDRTPAPLAGSQDATTSRMYENRICDYAWALLSEILGQPYVYALDPAERDRQIAALRHALGAEPGTAR